MKSKILPFFGVIVVDLLLSVAGVMADDLPPINDGPYVVWTGPNQATVFYICNDSLISQSFTDIDTLHIRAGCDASSPTLAVPAAPSAVTSDSFLNVTKIFAVSDIHGEHEAFEQLLRAAGIINEALAWGWGDGHLVVCGDVCDRGDKVTEAYWLIYRLEQEAAKAGGGVHMILGNHERKDMRGEDNDVNEVYTKGIVMKSKIWHEDLYGPDTEIGQWLRICPTVIKLNDIIFLHGGLSPEVAAKGMGIVEINRKVRESLGLRTTQLAFAEVPKFLFGDFGPMWYRGLFMSKEGKYDQLVEVQVNQVLQEFGASAMVVGHTEHDHADAYFGGLVWGLDQPVKEVNSMEGLLWQDGHVYRVSGSGVREQLR